MKIQTLREMTRDELLQKKVDLEDELFNLNMRKAIKALDNPLRLRTIGREIAQILTLLNEDTKGISKLAESSTSILPQAGSAKQEKGE